MFFIRKFIPQTLVTRFLLIIIVPTLIGQILVIFLFYDRHWYNVSYYTSSIIINEIKSLVDDYQTSNASHNLVKKYLNFSYQFHPAAGLPLKPLRLKEELEIFKNILDVKIKIKNIVCLNDQGRIEVLLRLAGGIMAITFPAKLLINPTTHIFVLWLIFLTSLLLSISLIFSRNQIKSILALASAAEAFGKGLKLLQPYRPSGAREIRLAGLAFLKMRDRIERQITKRTQMLAMISHDLRTPLTRMKLQLALMNSSSSAEKAGFDQDIMSMQQMIDSYLDFAKGEGGEQFEQVAIAAWLIKIINCQWQNCQVDLSGLAGHTIIQIKPHSFERAITNLMTNAVKYATKIKISVQENHSQLMINIEDNGPSIQDAEKILVFRPFYRSDLSRSLNNSANVGLGLSITKEIITGHYGSITLEDSRQLGGLSVKIILPVATKSQSL